MPRTARAEAVILRTIDIGEADRLCILFTKDAGRFAARARSVRKPGSRLGGTLLPFRHITVELSRSESHNTITGAVDRGDLPPVSASFSAYVKLQQGIDLLLALTDDDESQPAVFDLILQFIRLSMEPDHSPLTAFKLRLLHLLGLLPDSASDARFHALSTEGKAFVQACTKIVDLALLTELSMVEDELESFVRLVTTDQLQRPLKSENM